LDERLDFFTLYRGGTLRISDKYNTGRTGSTMFISRTVPVPSDLNLECAKLIKADRLINVRGQLGFLDPAIPPWTIAAPLPHVPKLRATDRHSVAAFITCPSYIANGTTTVLSAELILNAGGQLKRFVMEWSAFGNYAPIAGAPRSAIYNRQLQSLAHSAGGGSDRYNVIFGLQRPPT
jgi:hypothetical protein